MKLTRKLINCLVVCGLALAMVATASAQASRDRIAKVVRVKGAARYSTGNNVWQPVKIGTLLKGGNLIQTAANSFIDISLDESGDRPVRAIAADVSAYTPKAEQDVIRVYQDTVLSIDKLTVMDTGADQVTETQLDLRSGKIFGTVKKLSTTSRYEIKLPNGVAGIRGTIYTISADGVVQVLVGSVVVSWVGTDGTPHTQTVSGGNQFDSRTGLVSPIPNYIQKELVKTAKEMRIGPNTPAQEFVTDHTIYFVSPTKGHNGNQGGNGGNQGGNGNGNQGGNQQGASVPGGQ